MLEDKFDHLAHILPLDHESFDIDLTAAYFVTKNWLHFRQCNENKKQDKDTNFLDMQKSQNGLFLQKPVTTTLNALSLEALYYILMRFD